MGEEKWKGLPRGKGVMEGGKGLRERRRRERLRRKRRGERGDVGVKVGEGEGISESWKRKWKGKETKGEIGGRKKKVPLTIICSWNFHRPSK